MALKVREEIRAFEQALRALGSAERAAGAKAYLKSDLEFLGVAVPEQRKLVAAWLKAHPDPADAMLHEQEFFIRKAIGWVLRETASKDPERVFAYLKARIGRVSGLTLREGAKRLPRARRDELLRAYRS